MKAVVWLLLILAIAGWHVAVTVSPDKTALQAPLTGSGVGAVLEVFPSSVQLVGPFDSAQLVVMESEAGSKFDITRQVVAVVSGDAVAVSPSGMVRPLADGDAEIRITRGEHSIKVPVRVRGIRQQAPVNFIRDVMPLLSKLGCNQGTCHGSEEGKNGFKLSLRGYDPQHDYRMFADDLAARRINRAAPEESLVLLKPGGVVPHGGGFLLHPGEPEYETLRNWIAQGVAFDPQTPRVARIQIEPTQPVIQRDGQSQQMRVVATYADGKTRDMTAEAFLETGDADVATVDRAGLVTALRRGEAPILARFEGAYATTIVTVMGSREGFFWREAPIHNRIDELVDAKLRRTQTLPSSLCTDDEFLRRIYLDLTGLPPSANAVRAFLADSRPTRIKRDEVIDRLIGSPQYVDYWTHRWCDLLLVNRRFLGEAGAAAFRGWVRQVVADNLPYDKFAQALLTASGSNRENPAAAYYKILRDPHEALESSTQLFLGIRFNCNRCHDHPFERWTQDQYYGLAAFFARVGRDADPASGDQKVAGMAVEGDAPLYEIVFDKNEGEVRHERTGEPALPAFPYQADLGTEGKSRRELLSSWLTSPQNDYFARSYANRVWGYLLGRGLIEPLDDLRAGNPPTNSELLDHLTDVLRNSGFNSRELIRVICRSRTYQASIETNSWNEDDHLNYSHALPRRLPAEVLFDAIHFVTGSTSELPSLPAGSRAVELPDVGAPLPTSFLDQFGRAARQSVCECQRDAGLSLPPIMALVNGPTLAEAIADPRGAITQLVSEQANDTLVVEELFYRILNRPPTQEEVAVGLAALRAPAAAQQVAQQALKEYEQTFSDRLAQWERDQRNVTWVPLTPRELSSDKGITLTGQENGWVSVRGSKKNVAYTFLATTDQKSLAGFRLELEYASHPAGPSSDDAPQLPTCELSVSIASSAGPARKQPVPLLAPHSVLTGATAADAQPETSPSPVTQMIVLATAGDVGNAEGTAELGIALAPQQTPLRFRVLTTTAPRETPLVSIPREIETVLAIAAGDRTAKQQAALSEFFRAVDPALRELTAAWEASAPPGTDPRLAGAQDLAWALINSPAFLFNR